MKTSATTASQDAITLQLKWKHQFQSAGFYIAIEKGYYAEANLDVTLREATGSLDTIDAVLDDTAQYGVAASDLIIRRCKGAPIVALAPLFQHSPAVWLFRADAPIHHIHDLAGKRLMVEAQSAELLAYLQKEGVSLEKATQVPHEYGVRGLIDRRVDAMTAYSTDELFLLDQQGVEYRYFTPVMGGIDFYGDTLFTTERELRNHRDRAERFLKASLRGWRYAFENIEDTVDLILANYSTDKDRAALLFEADALFRLTRPQDIPIGHHNQSRWVSMALVYEELGRLEDHDCLDGFIYERLRTIEINWLFSVLVAVAVMTSIIFVVALAVTALSAYGYAKRWSGRMYERCKRRWHCKVSPGAADDES